MEAVIVQVRDRTKASVTAPMVLWSLVVAVTLFMLEAPYGTRSMVFAVGLGATALFGAYLGWNRRVAVSFVAPIISWFAAWFPLIVASMIHHGFFAGLALGLFYVTVGWFAVALLEFVGLFIVASLVRMLRGATGLRVPDVMVFGPDGEHR